VPAPGEAAPAEPAATGEPPAAPPVDAQPTDLEAFAASTFAFAADVHGKLRAAPGNLVWSPASLAAALTMTWAGAQGDTAEEMAAALHLTGDPGAAHRAAGATLRLWATAPEGGVELTVANRLFGQRGYAFEGAFLGLLRDTYAAPLEEVDFRADPPGARQRINAWVSERTQRRIPELLPQRAVDPLTRLVLANAVYFRGAWRTRFDEHDTDPRPFAAPGAGDPVSVPTMALRARLPYAEAPGAQVVALPYEGEQLWMVLVVPRDTDGLARLEPTLDATRLRGLLQIPPRTAGVALWLPRFRVAPAASVALRPVLAGLGMRAAFDPGRADLRGMARPAAPAERLHVHDVYHQARIEVTEQGTVAAAASGVVVRARGAAAPEPRVEEVHADRPFLFALVDRRVGGAPLFLGRVVNPR
jgi:serpin B